VGRRGTGSSSRSSLSCRI